MRATKPLRDAFNQQHLDNPEIGDYWQEHFCVYHLVLDVLLNGNLVIAKRDLDFKEGQRFRLEAAEEITKEQHKKLVMYSDLSGFVASCVSGSQVALGMVEEWTVNHNGHYLKLEQTAPTFEPTDTYPFREFRMLSHPTCKPVEAICQFEYKGYQISISTAGTLSGGCQKEVTVFTGPNRDHPLSDYNTVEEAIDFINGV